MKKFFVCLLILIISIGSVATVGASDRETSPEIFAELERGYDHLVLSREDGVWIQRGFIERVSGYDVPFVEYPDVYGGLNVPFRLLAESIGWTVIWDPDQRSVVARLDADPREISLAVSDQPYPMIVADRLMLPLDIVIDLLSWDHGRIEVISISDKSIVLRISTLG